MNNMLSKKEKMKSALSSNAMIVIYIIVVLLILIAAINPEAFGPATFINTARAMLTMLMFALCEMLVIISGGIDVSFPAIATFAMYSTTKLMIYFGLDGLPLAFLISGVIGLGWGVLNGFLVGTFKIPTLIATLGTSSLVHGALLSFVGVNDITNLPSTLDNLGKAYLFQVETSSGVSSMSIFIILPIILCFVFWFLLRYTMLGRSIYAIGGNVNSAQRAGFNVVKTQYFIYMFVGAVVGIAGMTYTLLGRNANTTQLMGSEMMVIAAVVIGGARITGGHGNVLGTILGVVLINLVSNNLIVIGIPAHFQTFVIGVLIIVGVCITSFKAKRVSLSPKI